MRTFKYRAAYTCKNEQEAIKIRNTFPEFHLDEEEIYTVNRNTFLIRYFNINNRVSFLNYKDGINLRLGKPHLIDNIDTFLAIAQQQEGEDFHVGEYIKCIVENGEPGYKKDHLFQIGEVAGGRLTTVIDSKGSTTNGWGTNKFIKATLEEIVEHFNKNQNMKKIVVNGSKNLKKAFIEELIELKFTPYNKDTEGLILNEGVAIAICYNSNNHFQAHFGLSAVTHTLPQDWDSALEAFKLVLTPKEVQVKVGYLEGDITCIIKKDSIQIGSIDVLDNKNINVLKAIIEKHHSDYSYLKDWKIETRTMDIGCKKGVYVEDLKALIAEYDKLNK